MGGGDFDDLGLVAGEFPDFLADFQGKLHEMGEGFDVRFTGYLPETVRGDLIALFSFGGRSGVGFKQAKGGHCCDIPLTGVDTVER